MEFGPFTYQEYQTFDDLEYTKVKQSEVSGSFSESVDTEMDAVWATFSSQTRLASVFGSNRITPQDGGFTSLFCTAQS